MKTSWTALFRPTGVISCGATLTLCVGLIACGDGGVSADRTATRGDTATAGMDAGAADNGIAAAPGQIADDAMSSADRALDNAADKTQQAVEDTVDDAKPALSRATDDTARGLDRLGQTTGRALERAGSQVDRAGRHVNQALQRDADRLQSHDGDNAGG